MNVLLQITPLKISGSMEFYEAGMNEAIPSHKDFGHPFLQFYQAYSREGKKREF